VATEVCMALSFVIEIEKKLNPSLGTIELIKNDAVFVVSKKMSDIYYDYEDFSLMKNDVWLRKRDGKFELKISKDKDRKNRSVDVYDEIEEEAQICMALGVRSISNAGFIEVANLLTKREKYKLGEFNIDLDFVTSAHDDFVHHLMEVELMAEDESKVPNALEKINVFIKNYNIDKFATSKLMQYFYERKRYVFDLLQNV
jgi:adenylate cyclase class IV